MDGKANNHHRSKKIGGWILAIVGVALLIRAAINGHLYGSAETYGITVITIAIYFRLATPRVANGLDSAYVGRCFVPGRRLDTPVVPCVTQRSLRALRDS